MASIYTRSFRASSGAGALGRLSCFEREDSSFSEEKVAKRLLFLGAPDVMCKRRRNKSLFASFSSEKEDSSFFSKIKKPDKPSYHPSTAKPADLWRIHIQQTDLAGRKVFS